MRKYTIGICGAPRVGKTTLMKGLASWLRQAKQAEVSISTVQRGDAFCACQMTVLIGDSQLLFSWIPGVAIHAEAASAWVLEQSDAVVYVFDPVHHRQIECYDLHLAVADRFGKSPPKIPWLLVSNLIEPRTHCLDTSPLPSDLKVAPLLVNAKTGDGIDELWAAVKTFN